MIIFLALSSLYCGCVLHSIQLTTTLKCNKLEQDATTLAIKKSFHQLAFSDEGNATRNIMRLANPLQFIRIDHDEIVCPHATLCHRMLHLAQVGIITYTFVETHGLMLLCPYYRSAEIRKLVQHHKYRDAVYACIEALRQERERVLFCNVSIAVEKVQEADRKQCDVYRNHIDNHHWIFEYQPFDKPANTSKTVNPLPHLEHLGTFEPAVAHELDKLCIIKSSSFS